MSRICFVLPESSHIDHNGIPSVIYHFAKLSEENNHDVTALFTSASDPLLEYWKAKYQDAGIRFEYLQPSDININLSAADLFFRHSYAVYLKLQNSDYNFICFTEFYALGFHTIQAQRTTSLFQNTTIGILMLGGSEYMIDRQKAYYAGGSPVFEMRLQYAERYCCENADVLIGTAALFAWANRQGWMLAQKQHVLEDLPSEKELDKAVWLDISGMLPGSTRDISDKPQTPKVSVCIAYYNHGKYLPMLLESLEKNSYPNFEVIVVNDGSTDACSISIFEEMSVKYQAKPFRFYSKENEYMGKTRNYAVDRASGEYIIFADSDDVVAPDMIEKFVAGMLRSGCDCLSGYMRYFDGELPLEHSIISQGIYTPTGPVLELTLFENCVGGVNIVIKRDVFLAAGGFSHERYSYEDWRFLIGISLKGYRLDVIPLSLYYYRILPDSMNRSKDDYESRNWLLSIYYNEMPRYMKYLIKGFCLPSWDMWLERGMVRAKNLEEHIARLQKQVLDIQNQNTELQDQNRTLRNYTSIELLKRVARRVYNRIFARRK